MKKKVIETTIPLITYLNLVKEGNISQDQDVQRKFCSDNPFVNGIAVTTTTNNYLPPIILGEVPIGGDMIQSYVVDGNQRTDGLMMIRFGKYKITSATEDSEIEYQAKALDENGKVIYTEDGTILWEQKTFDIKNKTFDEFPLEIQREFDNFQLRIVTHQNCSKCDLSKLVRKYNNHKGMNTSQRAFTYLDLFARKVKNISSNNRFFKDTIKYSDSEDRQGKYERCICECVMTTKFNEKWKSNPKTMNTFLNENASANDFDLIDKYATRLNSICDDNYQDIFVLKNVAVWFKTFDTFTKYRLDDKKFVDFLNVFKESLHSKEVENNLSFDIIEENTHTKDKKVINTKIQILEKLMLDYFNIDDDNNIIVDRKEEIITPNTIEFLKQNVSSDIEEDDIEFYEESLDDYLVEVPQNSKILEPANTKSMIAICAYSYDVDEDLGEWLVDYVGRNDDYVLDQKQNFLHMKDDFDKFFGISKKQDIA